MDATDPALVLLVGAPRSGTTWLQRMLGSHPSVATPQETDLFSRYVGPLHESWRRPLRGGPHEWARHRYKGLAAVLTTPEFVALVRAFIRGALAPVAALKPGATVIVEKSPSHSDYVEVIAEYAPEARVVHLVRDGRDVVTSLLAASEGWGSGWAPPTLRNASRKWVEHVRGARASPGAGLAYHEVRYEALVAGDADALRDVFEFCGAPCTRDEAIARLDEHRFETMASTRDAAILVGGEFAAFAAERREPEGFFRRGEVGSWRGEWRAPERLLFDAIAGELLVELGYEPDRSWVASPAARRAFELEVAARRVAAGAARRVGRLGGRLSRRIP